MVGTPDLFSLGHSVISRVLGDALRDTIAECHENYETDDDEDDFEMRLHHVKEKIHSTLQVYESLI